jgi:hypothetical protein
MQWENLKKEFRSVEGEVEEKLLRYSKSGGSQNFQQSQSLEYEIEGALKNVNLLLLHIPYKTVRIQLADLLA